jgi:hypothetical protein
MALIEAGYEVVLATPSGSKPHIDEASDAPEHFGGDKAAYERAKAFYANDPAIEGAHAEVGHRRGDGQLCRRVCSRRAGPSRRPDAGC